MYNRNFRPNAEGEVLVNLFDEHDSAVLADWSGLLSAWLDDMIKNAGFPDAFKLK